MSLPSELNDFLRGGLPTLLDWPTAENAPPPRAHQFSERTPPKPDPDDIERVSYMQDANGLLKSPWVWAGAGVLAIGVLVLALKK